MGSGTLRKTVVSKTQFVSAATNVSSDSAMQRERQTSTTSRDAADVSEARAHLRRTDAKWESVHQIQNECVFTKDNKMYQFEH